MSGGAERELHPSITRDGQLAVLDHLADHDGGAGGDLVGHLDRHAVHDGHLVLRGGGDAAVGEVVLEAHVVDAEHGVLEAVDADQGDRVLGCGGLAHDVPP